jgi:hypothetical protein
MLRLDNIIKDLEYNPYNILSYKQTQNDLDFINIFYLNLDRLFNLINISTNVSTNVSTIKFVINSWVSFKNLDGYSENYNMFPNLLTLANKYNIIATEWDFTDELFYAKIISKYNFGNNNFNGIKINYAFDEYLSDLTENVVMMNFNYNNLFVIDFNSPYYLKKIDFVI